MQIPEVPTVGPDLQLPAPAAEDMTTPQAKIDRSVRDGSLSQDAGETLTSLFTPDINHSPEDLQRHKEMMDIVIENAANVGKRMFR